MRTEALPDVPANCNFYDLAPGGASDYASVAAFLAAKGATAFNEVLLTYNDHIESAPFQIESTGGGTVTIIGNDQSANYKMSVVSTGLVTATAAIGISTSGGLIDVDVNAEDSSDTVGLAFSAIVNGGKCVGVTVGDIDIGPNVQNIIGVNTAAGSIIDAAIRKNATWSTPVAASVEFYNSSGNTNFFNCTAASGKMYGFYNAGGSPVRTNCVAQDATVGDVFGIFINTTNADGQAITLAANGITPLSDPGTGTDLSGSFTKDIWGRTWFKWNPGAEIYTVGGVVSPLITDPVSDIITSTI